MSTRYLAIAGAAALALGTAAFAFGVSTPPAGLCDRPRLTTDAWTVDSGSAFTLRLTPGSHRTPMQGVDSEVGGWEAPSIKLWYDYGAYSNPLVDSLSRSGVVCTPTIGGRRARLVLFRDKTGEYAVGVYWAKVKASSVGPLALMITGVARDSAGRDSLLAVLWSVRFK